MLKRERTKELLIESAAVLFKQNGYYETSVDDIVKKAGVAKGTYYYYFKQKDDVLLTLIKKDFDKYFSKPEEIVFDSKLNALEKMEKVFKLLLAEERNSSDIEGFFSDGFPEKFQTPVDEIRLKKVLPLMMKLVKDGTNEGVFKVENTEVIASIITRGITSHIQSTFLLLGDYEYLINTIKGIEELINNVLKTERKIKLSDD